VRTGAAIVAAFVALTHVPQSNAKPPRWWVRDALCIHDGYRHTIGRGRFGYPIVGDVPGTGEGAWNANTGNGYYGGLQMDESFARTYGGWIFVHHGFPHQWKPATQLLVAYRGWLDRGWYPWPNTARMCGLI